jgi:integrase
MSKGNLELIEKNQTVSILKNRMILRENKSEQTLIRYLDGIKEFTKFMNTKNPDEALTEFRKITDQTDKLDEFIDYMLKKGTRPIDLKAKWHGVKKWLITNRIEGINWDYISRPKAISQIKDRIPTIDELRLILDNKVTLRDKAFFLVVASAGFRLGTAITLKVKDYQPIEDLGIITIEGQDGRKLATGKSYFTFITPEARRILDQYLKTRESLTPDSPLFAKESKGQGQAFDFVTNASRQWTVLVKRAKLLEKVEGHRAYTLHGHSLRKFFQTHCKLAGCRADFVDFWLGHHPQGQSQYLNDSYFRPELKEHITEYRKAISKLTVYDTIGQERINHIEEENKKLKLSLSRIEKKLENLQEYPKLTAQEQVQLDQEQRKQEKYFKQWLKNPEEQKLLESRQEAWEQQQIENPEIEQEIAKDCQKYQNERIKKLEQILEEASNELRALKTPMRQTERFKVTAKFTHPSKYKRHEKPN